MTSQETFLVFLRIYRPFLTVFFSVTWLASCDTSCSMTGEISWPMSLFKNDSPQVCLWPLPSAEEDHEKRLIYTEEKKNSWDVISFYLYLICFIIELSAHFANWIEFYLFYFIDRLCCYCCIFIFSSNDIFTCGSEIWSDLCVIRGLDHLITIGRWRGMAPC